MGFLFPLLHLHLQTAQHRQYLSSVGLQSALLGCNCLFGQMCWHVSAEMIKRNAPVSISMVNGGSSTTNSTSNGLCCCSNFRLNVVYSLWGVFSNSRKSCTDFGLSGNVFGLERQVGFIWLTLPQLWHLASRNWHLTAEWLLFPHC